MSIGSVGSSSLNTMLQTGLKIQAIGKDPRISDAAKRKMIQELRMQTGGIVDAAEQSKAEADNAQLVGSTAGASVPGLPVSSAENPSATHAALPGGTAGHSGSDGLAKGITINKIG